MWNEPSPEALHARIFRGPSFLCRGENVVNNLGPHVDGQAGGATWIVEYHLGPTRATKQITRAQAVAINSAPTEALYRAAVVSAVGTAWIAANIPADKLETWYTAGWVGVQEFRQGFAPV